MEEFEREVRVKELKIAGGMCGTTIGKKRSRCLYLPDDKNNAKNSVLPPELLGTTLSSCPTDNNSLADEKVFSISAKHDYSAADLDDSLITETSRDIGVLNEKEELEAYELNRRPFIFPCGKVDIISRNQKLDTNGAPDMNADPEDQSRAEFDTKNRGKLDFGVEKRVESPIVDAQMEDTSRNLTDLRATTLFEVHLSVQAGFREEHVPYVCLMSQAYGKPILGYPLELGALSNSSETFHPFDGEEISRIRQPAWRTSRRTPVCYITNSHFYTITKDAPTKQEKLSKNPNHFNKGRALDHKTCIPVVYIFSKILTAVGMAQS